MKALTKTAVLLGVLLLACPILADEPATGGEATQDAVFGADLFDDVRLANSHQGGTELAVYATDVVLDEDAGEASEFRGEVGWWPTSLESWRLNADAEGAGESFYVNDSWQLGDRFSFEVEVEADASADGE